jgi:REP element-mobilizing transposase RayT
MAIAFAFSTNFMTQSYYCAVSGGGAPLEVVKRYIEEQRAEPRKKGEKRRKAASTSP